MLALSVQPLPSHSSTKRPPVPVAGTPWLVSGRFDLAMLLLPLLGAILCTGGLLLWTHRPEGVTGTSNEDDALWNWRWEANGPAAESWTELIRSRSSPSAPMPLWGFLLVTVCFDVAHVWASMYRYLMLSSVRSRGGAVYLLMRVEGREVQ
jgi:hypothetical protein